jgi:Flp pilus assembly protein TadD
VAVTSRHLFLASLAAACWAVSGGAALGRAQAPAAGPAGDGALRILAQATANARTTWARLAGAQPRNAPGATQYQDGLTKLQAGQYAEALAPLQAAARLNANNAIFHSDLAAASAGIERWDDAALELVRARQIQPGNQWFTVALAAVKAVRAQWADASLNLDVAISADSAIIDSTIVEAAVSWAANARRVPQMIAWSQLATERFPGIAEPWYRLAGSYQQQNDTTRGIAAIRRYIALRPTDRTGLYLYSYFLFITGQNDSALVFATEAARDSSLQERAGEVLFGVGARMLQASKADTAVLALSRARTTVTAELQPRVSLFLGYAQLSRFAEIYQQSEPNRACEPAMRLDSLLSQAAENLRAGAALDSARVAPIIEGTIPQYRVRTAAMVSQYCRGRRP